MEEAIRALAKALFKVFEEMRNSILKIFGSVKNTISEVEVKKQKRSIYEPNYNWRVIRDTTRNHQILNRKPLFINARANL